METAREMLQELDEAAWTIAEAGLDETGWMHMHMKRRVIDLTDGANRMVAILQNHGSGCWHPVRWDEGDPAVMLARAFGKAHRRLAAAVDDHTRMHIVADAA